MFGYWLSILITAVAFFAIGRSYGWHVRDALAWKETTEAWRSTRSRMLGRAALDQGD